MDKKEKLQGMLDQIDEKTGTKSVRSARQERIEKLVREMSDDADIKEELVRTRLTFRKYLTEFATKIGSLDGIVDAIKRNKVEYPKQIDVKVTNTHDMPKSVFNVPSLFDIRKPTWIDTITSPIKAVNSKMDQVLQAIKNVKMSEDPEKPIAVRLSDGKKFYEAITQVFGGTQGNIINIPKVTLSGGQQAIPVVNPDGTDISGGSGGGDGAITDGATAAIKATVLDYTSSNPLAVRLTDTGGDYVAAGAGTQYTEDAAAAANPVGGTVILVREDGRAGSLTTTDGDNVALRGNNKGEAYVKTTDSDALLTTIDADTGNISTKIDTIAGAVTGTEVQVDVLTMPVVSATIGDGTNVPEISTAGSDASSNTKKGMAVYSRTQIFNGTSWDRLTGDTTGLNVKAIVGALPAGTNAIGKLAANSGVDIGDVDITSIAAGDNNIGNVDVVTLPALAAGTNAIGKLLPPDVDVTAHTNYVKKYYTSTGAATDGIVWSPAAGKRFHVVSMYLQTSAAATITLEDDKAGGDEAIWKGEFAANQGMTINFSEKYPLASGEDAADLIVTTSAGNIYITITGYEI